MIPSKTCSKCREELPLSSFWKSKSAKDGRQPACVSCQKQQNAEWRENNAEKRREYFAQPRFQKARKLYKKENPHLFAAMDATRRARKRGAYMKLTDLEKAAVKEMYRLRDQVSEWTGLTYEVDHITPLARGGKHHPNNLQLLTQAENRSKGASEAPKVGVLSANLFHSLLPQA